MVPEGVSHNFAAYNSLLSASVFIFHQKKYETVMAKSELGIRPILPQWFYDCVKFQKQVDEVSEALIVKNAPYSH
jgi:hypothetical protein